MKMTPNKITTENEAVEEYNAGDKMSFIKYARSLGYTGADMIRFVRRTKKELNTKLYHR